MTITFHDDNKKPALATLNESVLDYGSLERSEFSSDESGSVESEVITDFKTELKTIGKSSAPLIVTLFLQYSLTVVSIFSVGHLGKTELAAASLATMTFNISNAIFNGMSTSLDTLCSQAYGAGNKKLVGLHFQRCSAMIFVISIPIVFIWWISGSILGLFVLDKELTDLAQFYMRIISFGTPGFILFETGKRFLQAQGIFNAAQNVLFICTPINIILNYILVWDTSIGIGFAGAPLAIAINYNLMAALLFCYVFFIDGRECWGGLQLKKSLENWGPMVSLALPGVIMVEAEFFAFEILTLSAARLGTATLAAQSIVSSIGVLAFQIPFAISIAGSTRIATHIGSQSSKNAKTATRVSMSFSAVIGSISAVVLYCGRFSAVSSYTNDEEVISIAASAVRVLAFNQIADSVNVIAAGCLRGQGRQRIGGYLNLLAYYLVALPLAFYFAFSKKLELIGLWMGLGAGIIVLAGSETFYVFNADWNSILGDSFARNRASS